MVRRSSRDPIAWWILARTSSLVRWWGSTSFPWLVFFFGALLWGSMIHKHTGRWMWQGKRIICILELREILLSFQTGFRLVNAAVVCAILQSISGLEPSSVKTEPRYLKLVTVSSFCPFNFCADATGGVCHQLGLLGTDLNAIACGGFIKTLYEFCMLAPDDLRIVVFTNKPVDLSALTYDRWQLNDLQRRDGLLPEHGNMGLYVHRNH